MLSGIFWSCVQVRAMARSAGELRSPHHHQLYHVSDRAINRQRPVGVPLMLSLSLSAV